jgi:hypothetical protein
VLYLVASDYFHVVRAAAYEALYQMDESTAVTPGADSAS